MPASTFVIHPQFKTPQSQARDPRARLEEAEGLARAIDLPVALSLIVPIAQPRPSTLFGKGKVEELKSLVEQNEIALAVIDHALSPVQQRNLEKAWGCKVIDRTALILEIFGARARTNEGKLQVELAALEYQKTRLVRSWTHLERQRGGFGFLGGPGESQIEIDRRLIRDRIAKLKKELEQVIRTRQLHRKQRARVPYPIVALVGYTNAGKSTLFNRLTGADVLSMDKLFATLDPTLRAIRLPSGANAILSDTVGFVSDLPHELVAAFRATLEEVLEADIILHVRDIAHADSEAQKRDVETVLKRLFSDETLPDNVIEVRNKTDLLAPEARMSLERDPRAVAVSALDGAGLERLTEVLDAEISARFLEEVELFLPAHEGEALAWLYRHGQVAEQGLEGERLHLRVRLTPQNRARFTRLFASETVGAP